MADYGLLGGIGEGLSSFMQTYNQVKQRNDEQKYKNIALNLEAHKQHVTIGSDGQITPDGNEGQYGGFLRDITKSQMKLTHPEYTDDQLETMVPKGLMPEQYKEAASLTKPELSGYYSMLGQKARGEAFSQIGKERNAIAREGLGLRKGVVAQGINKEVMHDKVVAATDTQQNSIAKGIQQLNSTDKPITVQMLNEIQADYANALAGGRVAAQGTIHDQQMQSLEGKAAGLKQYITGDPTQAATPKQIAYFKTAFNELRGLNQKIRQQRVQTLTKQAGEAFGTGGNFGQVINNLNQDSSGQGLVPEQPQSKTINGKSYIKVNGGWQEQ